MANPLGLEAQVDLVFDEAIQQTKAALKAEGFGILTEIDLQAAFKEKIGAEFRPFVILGACDPNLAYATITANPLVGLLLPCNVTVEANSARRSTVRVTDPTVLLTATGVQLPTELQQVAQEARTRLMRVVRALSTGAAAG
jgi:uncharacterized protein (DUF302 family)